MDDYMDITTTPCYFARYPGHYDSYREVFKEHVLLLVVEYIFALVVKKLGKRKEHQTWIQFRRRGLNVMLC